MMGMNVSEESVRDLLEKIHFSPSSGRQRMVIEALMEIGPFLESVCDKQYLQTVAELFLQRDPDLDEECVQMLVNVALDCVGELDYHFDKCAFLEAALSKIKDIEQKAERLKKLQGPIKDLFRTMDPQTRAILEIYSELDCVDSYLDTDYSNVVNGIGPESPPESTAPLLAEAYRIAQELNSLYL